MQDPTYIQGYRHRVVREILGTVERVWRELEVDFKGYKFQLHKIMKFLEIIVKCHGYDTVLFKIIRKIDFMPHFFLLENHKEEHAKNFESTLIALIAS